MITKSMWLAVALLMADLSGPASAADNTLAQSGGAAIYSHRSGKTASGEKTDPKGLTAAHRSLPFGTMVRVTNTRNGRSIVVRINDRGPFTRGRVIDVTPAAARALGFSGVAAVKLSRDPDGGLPPVPTAIIETTAETLISPVPAEIIKTTVETLILPR
jgi:rare lipoprotein A